MSILVLNAGSSTLKFTLFDAPALAERAAGTISWQAESQQARVSFRLDGADRPVQAVAITGFDAAVKLMLDLLQPQLAQVKACGHRVVHGGIRFRSSVRIDAEVKTAIRELSELAPLHNPPALAGIDAIEKSLPELPQVAVFDTAFFADQPEESYLYPVPYRWYTDWGIRRFGFHGISHQYCTGRVRELLPGRSNLVICHLGNGCSASAVRDGKALTSTMGYTPLEGLMMGTRSGSVDPGILLHLLQRGLMSAEQLDHALNHASGLLGVSGVSSDWRGVEEAANRGEPRSRAALALFATRVKTTIGALAAMLGGIDVLVFTAGIGAHSGWLRREACRGLECLGLFLDVQRNESVKPDADIALDSSPGRILVLHTQEELLIARETFRIAGPNWHS